jgi:hypothetical protein
MGLLEGMKRRRQLRQAIAVQRADSKRLAMWQEQMSKIDEWIDTATKCARGDIDGLFEPFDTSFVLKAGEYAIASLSGIGFIETKRAPSTYSGGYGGVSFPIFGRVRGHVGGTRGRVTPGDESLQIIDTGDAIVTNVRMMFKGTTHAQEWPFRKIMACEHIPGGITTFAVSGRSKTSGIAYGELNSSEIQYRIELAIALCVGTTDKFLAELNVEREKILANQPASLVSGESPPSSSPAP